MIVKAVFCDIDGTLLNKNNVVSAFTLEMIRELNKKGILFGLCTGRESESVKNSLTEWKLDGLVDVIIGCGGAEYIDKSLGIEAESYPLEGFIIKEIIHHYEDLDVNFAVPYKGVLYTVKDDRHIQDLSFVDGVPYEVVNFDEFLKQPKPKIMIKCDPDYMNIVIERSKTFTVNNTKAAGLITCAVLYEYMDTRVSKTSGLNKVLSMHGISLEECCVFGDADNDYDMILNAGIGVVMANGSEKTKSVANYITDDNNHDGIGKFIKKYILTEE